MALEGLINLTRTGLALPKAYVKVLSVAFGEDDRATIRVAVYADEAARKNNRQPVETLDVTVPAAKDASQGGLHRQSTPAPQQSLTGAAACYTQLKLVAPYSAMADW